MLATGFPLTCVSSSASRQMKAIIVGTSNRLELSYQHGPKSFGYFDSLNPYTIPVKKALSGSLFHTGPRKVKSLGLSILQVSEAGFKSRPSGPSVHGPKYRRRPGSLSTKN